MLVTSDDLIVDASVDDSLRKAITRRRMTDYVSFTIRGRGRVNISNDLEDMEAHVAAKYLLAREKHVAFIREGLISGFLPILNGEQDEVSISHAGITSVWDAETISRYDLLFVSQANVLARTTDVFVPTDESGESYTVVDPHRMKFDGPLAEAYARARKRALANSLVWDLGANLWLRSDHRLATNADGVLERVATVTATTMRNMARTVKVLRDKAIVSHDMLREARNDMLRERARDLDTVALQKRASSERFATYWENLKSRKKSVVDKDEVLASFKAVPLRPNGTEASRTWGIEIETIHAELTNRPAGWDRRYDGSLSNDDGEGSDCNCGCDDCDDGSHCEYDDCYSSSEGGDCAEFVSPILNHYNSSGLRQLCEDLGGSVVNSTPGIHVHVGAGDLSIPDVARLARAYSIVSPFLWPLMDRTSFGYCRDVSSENIAFWLAQARRDAKAGVVSAVQVAPVERLGSQPDNRYRDLNLQALAAHGTIEFRAMGPIYDYEHLVRWAWICREMVNISKLELLPEVWTEITSMADLVAVLRTFGQELYPDGFADLDVSELLDLSVERSAEMDSGF